MEKEKLYHVALDDYEHGVVIRSLNDEKTKLMEEGNTEISAGRWTQHGNAVWNKKD